MHAQCAAIAPHQDVEISSGLGRLDHTEGVLPSRHRHINGVIARDLKEDPRRVGPPSDRLPIQWQAYKARPEFELTCRDPPDIAKGLRHRPRYPGALVHLDVRQKRDNSPS